MSFKFSLATLLRLREIDEQREERLLSRIQNQIVQSRQTLADLALQRGRALSQREDHLNQTMSAVELMNSYGTVRAIEDLLKTGQENLNKLVMLKDQQMKVYQAAHRKSQVLAEMRDEHREVFDKQLLKAEQNVMDDNFSSRMGLK